MTDQSTSPQTTDGATIATATITSTTPVVRERVVNAPIETCFRVFVDGFGGWWPPEHHIGEDRTVNHFEMEGFVGGRCFDVDTSGGVCQWGTVLEIDRPRRLVLAWHIQGDWTIDLDPARQSEIEVTFTAVDATTTRVRVVHDRLERHGSGADGIRTGIDSPAGWTVILGRFADVSEGLAPRPLPS
jgi:uncharacterized protein YndB with AHSA1/START domain